MKFLVTNSLLLFLGLSSWQEVKLCNAFLSPHLKHKNIQNELKYQNLISSLNQSNNGNDPTKTWIAQFADGLQKVLTSSSPLNEGKKSLVRALAGEYDDEAVRAKLNGLISENQVLMLSFTT